MFFIIVLVDSVNIGFNTGLDYISTQTPAIISFAPISIRIDFAQGVFTATDRVRL